MDFWHPNETRVEEFSIENQGALTDSYNVTLNVSDPNWTVYLDRYGFEDVEPGERVFFNLTVTSPRRARSGDFVDITITAHSGGSPKTDILSFRLFIIVERAVTVRCENATLEVLPGAVAVFEVEVVNIGDVPDNYTVEYTVSPENQGWEVALDLEEVALDIGGGVTVTVRVSPKEGRTWEANVSVFLRVQSRSDASVWDGKRLQVLERSFLEASLEPMEGHWPMVPGGNLVLDINLSQRTNVGRTLEWKVRLDNASIEWDVVLNEEVQVLTGSTVSSIMISVTAPHLAPPGTTMTLLITVECMDWPDTGFLSVQTFAVPETRTLDMEIWPRHFVNPPGGVVEFNVTIENRGNVWIPIDIDLVSLYGRIETGLTLTIEEGSRLMAPGDRTVISVRYTISNLIPPGIDTVSVVVRDGDVEAVRKDLTIDVLENASVLVRNDGPVNATLDPNLPPVEVDLRVINDGNVPLQLHMAAIVLPDGSGVVATFEGMPALGWTTLGPGDAIPVKLVLDASAVRGDQLAHAGGTVAVDVFDHSGPSLWSGRVNFVLEAPDLSITGVERTRSEPPEGEQGLAVTVMNDGHGHSLPTHLSFSGNDLSEDLLLPVPALGPGENATIHIAFEASTGRHRYSLYVDPLGSVVEREESNNGRDVELEVKDPSEGGFGSNDPWIAWAIILTAALCVAVAHVLWGRRSKGRPEE